MGQFLFPFRGRNPSGASDLNFLWRSERLYVMDNHRAAMWCWWQHLAEAEQWDLLHIDRHYDTASAEPEMAVVPPTDADLQTYLDAKFPWFGGLTPAIRWDNYLWLFLKRHGDHIKDALFATPSYQGAAMPPEHSGFELIDPWLLLRYFGTIAEDSAAVEDGGVRTDPPWIVNVDLDYFTDRHGGGDRIVQVFSDGYISAIGEAMAKGLRAGVIKVATIALSPETTGGTATDKAWALSETLMKKLLRPWGKWPRIPAKRRARPPR